MVCLCDSGTGEYTFSLNVLMCKESGYENKMDEYTLSLKYASTCNYKETGNKNEMDL